MIRLLADIGGTHARFALAQDGHINSPVIFENAHFRSESELLEHVRREVLKDALVKTAKLAVAGPVSGKTVRLTNLNWNIQTETAAQMLGVQHVELVNDLAALALGIPQVPSGQLLTLAKGKPQSGPMAVIGVGTGIGTATLLDVNHRRQVTAAEGGHVSLPLVDKTLSLRLLSAIGELEPEAETLLSAAGLLRLFHAVDRKPSSAANSPEEVAALTRQGDPIACQAFDMYMQHHGLFARNLALSLGAIGGVYLAGAVLRDLADRMAGSDLIRHFTSGRQQDYLSNIPVTLIMDELVTFRGLAG